MQLWNFILRSILTLLTFFVIFGTHSPVAAIDPDWHAIEFTAVQSKNGLTQNSISAMLQDKDGYMWFSTLGGLHKYDGYKFTRLDPTLSDNVPQAQWLRTIYEDSSGNLWVGGVNGHVYRVDKDSGQMQDLTLRFNPKHFEAFTPESPPPFGGSINRFYQDKLGKIWVGSALGLAIYDPEYDNITLAPEQDWIGTKWTGVADIQSAHQGKIWLGTSQGLQLFDPQTQKAEQYSSQTRGANAPISDMVTRVYPDGNYIWVGSANQGLSRLNLTTDEFEHYQTNPLDPLSLGSNQITDIMRDSRQRLWIATTEGGLQLYDATVNGFVRFNKSRNTRKGIPSNDVWSLYEDSSNVVWIGTAGAGLIQVNPTMSRFDSITRIPYAPDSLEDDFVWDLALQQDKLWIATLNGLNSYDLNTGKIDLFQPNLALHGGVVNNAINAIAFDQQQNLWIGLTDGQLFAFTPSYQFIRVFQPKNGQKFSPTRIWLIHRDKSNNLWISANEGTYRLDPETQRQLVAGTALELTPAFTEVTRSMMQDSEGRLWFGLNNQGVKVLDTQLQQLALFRHDPNDPNSLSHNTVRAIHQTEDGQVYLGTIRGLNQLSADQVQTLTGNFQRYDSRDGLPDETIYSILSDANQDVWLATNNGLSHFNRETKRFANYDQRDGLIANEFNGGAEIQDAQGNLYFGGIKGVTFFNPESIKVNQKPPVTVLTGFKVNNQDWQNPYTLTSLQQVQLDYTQSNLEISFAALDYRQPLKNQFRYRLHPIQRDWVANGNQAWVNYPSLPPGNYVFQVQGTNNDGVWSEAIRELNIKITPPWWQHNLAFLLYTILIVSAFAWYQINQTQKLKREQQISAELARVNQLKDEFLANTSHELRTPLNGIIGLSETLLNNPRYRYPADMLQNLKMILSSGQRLSSLVNDILDITQLRQEQLALQQQHIDLFPIVDDVLEHTKVLIHGKSINISNNLEPEQFVVYADPQRVQQILQNLVSNAIKFTKQGSVVVSAYHDSDQIVVCVADTGVGIDSQQLQQIFDDFSQVDGSTTREFGGVGLGLSISKKLVELHQGKIWVKSQQDKGSQFYFELPEGNLQQVMVTTAEQAENVEDMQYDEVETDASPEQQSDGARLLVVDDEPVNRMVLRSHIKRLGHNVDLVEDGAKALEQVALHDYDLILLDVMMPGMSGIEVCQRLRQQYSLFQLPVLMVSAKTMKEDIVAGLEAGANDYITKPVEPSEFYARVKTLLSLKELEKTRGERDQAQEIAAANQELALHYAQFDQMTLLPNRSYLGEHLQQLIRDEKQQAILLCLVSLDRFKQVNEAYGHMLGDRILNLLGERLRHWCKQDASLFCARIGSDEFACVKIVNANQLTTESQACGDSLLQLIGEPIPFEQPPLVLHASIGFSAYPSQAQNQSDLLRFADLAMLKAKQSGGNQALMYDATASETLRGRLNIESTMREDIEKGAFQVYVQPLTSAQTGQIKSAEALVRWQRGGELVSPARFIPVAENSGLIVELGELVLDKVCQQVQLWLSQGIEVVPVAVNVSIIQFIRSDFVATLSRLLERYQVPAHYIEIEITESSMSDNVAELKQALSAIKQLGVRLAIDDFGTGFSSLSYLKSLPVDKLKIDRSFIQDLMQNKQSRNIVASVVKLAHDLELEVVSEGVEDELTLQQLRNMRVDTIQGYIISRPFPLAQLCDFHQQHQQQLA